jgi:hypothetical protein
VGATIRNQETGLVLKSAPEFGKDGAWPPVATEWTPLRWELFESAEFKPTTFAAYGLVKLYDYAFTRSRGSKKLTVTADFLRDDPLHNKLFSLSWALIGGEGNNFEVAYGMQIEGISAAHRRYQDTLTSFGYNVQTWSSNGGRVPRPSELRRVVHSERWRRQDPVIQLPPGATHEVTHSVTTGLTVERSKQLATSLGLNLGGNVVGIQNRLSSQVNKEFGFRLEITAQGENTRTLTLTNQSENRYRRFALWHIDHQITVAALDLVGYEPLDSAGHERLENSAIGSSHVRRWAVRGKNRNSLVESSAQPGRPGLLRPVWAPRGEAVFATADAAYVTYVEIDRS